MQIACPQCSMEYELDPRLLPPGGMPVQCTRCRHVFTARPPSESDRAPAPPVAVPPAAAAPPTRSAPGLDAASLFDGDGGDSSPSSVPTNPFGVPLPPVVPPVGQGRAAPSPTTTQAFGTPQPQPSPSPSPMTTQAFGTPPPTPPPNVFQVPEESRSEVIVLPPELLEQQSPPRRTGELPALGRPEPRSPRRTGEHALFEPPPELFSDKSIRIHETEGSVRWRNGLALVGMLVLLLGVGVLVARGVAQRKPNVLPADAQAAREEAALLLRRDDVASREEALGSLRTLAASYSENVELQADVAVALALQLDDVRVGLASRRQRREWLQREMSALRRHRAPADWQSRVNAMQEQVEQLRRETEPLEAQAGALGEQLVLSTRRMLEKPAEPDSPGDAQARLRARALLAAVTGTEEAIGLTGRLEQEGLHDWAALVQAEYALSARSPPASLDEASVALEAVREQDQTFLRAYVLGARIALARKAPDKAHVLLETVVTLNPRHELAHFLQQQATEVAREAEGSD